MKTGAWLRGGRGKIAGMVAQKSSDGKGTVLRELVIPKNPQTANQMATRLAFGTVTQAASNMIQIIGQSFRGQSDEAMNRRRFVALNVPLLKSEALSQSMNGAVNAIFRGKNSETLIPNAYRISEGSLVTPSELVPYVNQGNVALNPFASVTLVAGQSYKPSDILAQMFHCQSKQQVTLVAFVHDESDGVDNVVYTANNGDFIRQCYFAGYRIVLNEDAAAFEFTAQTTVEQIKAALRTGFDTDKTTSLFLADFIENVSLESNVISSDTSFVDVLSTMTGFETQRVVGLGVILSQLDNGNWDYNNATMAFVVPEGNVDTTNERWYGLSFNSALIDYIGAQAASTLFTRKGGLINEF